jgi:hypothetical protein
MLFTFVLPKSKAIFAEIPGVMETGSARKIDRRYSFNDACQWFIDHAGKLGRSIRGRNYFLLKNEPKFLGLSGLNIYFS